MFVPSILFWPSSIGKEALMQFAIGSAALGTAHLFNGKLVRGVLVGVPGRVVDVGRATTPARAWSCSAAGVAYLIGQEPARAPSRASSARRWSNRSAS